MKLRDIKKIYENEDVAQQAQQLIDQHCKQTVAAGNIFYRGIMQEAPERVIIRDTGLRKTDRESQTGSNALLSWTTQDESWKHVPRRTRSVFTSMSYRNASNFGNVIAIIPFDGTRLAVLKGEDMNFPGTFPAFGARCEALDGIEYFVKGMIYSLGLDDKQESSLMISYKNNLPATVKHIDQLLAQKDGETRRRVVERAMEEWRNDDLDAVAEEFNKTGSMEKSLRFALDANNVVDMVSSNNKIARNDNEVWFEGKYLVVPAESGLDIFDEYS